VRIALTLALDAAVICLFAAIGRRSHAETGALTSVMTTAWPFLVGLAAGWLVSLLALRRVPLNVREGVPVWLCTVAVGMLIRGLTGAGTAFSFVIVATVFLGAMLLGWRAVRLLSRPRRALKQRG
jgi:FtsH-binding integral membrane protein